ncbi:MAG: hypothetical protein IT458_18635 [Planctomycetes bacterium]|nr:hypothetical protein [Planctomycetota bacterium]
MIRAAHAALLAALAACAPVAQRPEGHVGPVLGRVTVAGRTFAASRAGVFEEHGATLRPLPDPGLRVFALAAAAGAPPRLLVAGGTPARSGEVALLDLDGAVCARARVADDVVYAVACAPDGGTAAAGCADGRVLVGAPAHLAGMRTAWRHTGAVQAVAFAPDGGALASGGLDGRILIGAPDVQAAPREVPDHTDGVLCLAWAPDGGLLASGARDGKVRLHERGGRLVRTWPRLGGAVQGVVWQADQIRYSLAARGGEPARAGSLPTR